MHLLKAAYLAGQNESLATQTAAFELLVKPGSGAREQASPTLKELEREHLERVLTETRTVEEAAQKLGIAASTLWRKRKRYNLK
jgi:NtrC-family two-component system response regulator AlgB